MQISAKYKAILEILEQVLSSKNPADVVLNQYLKDRKYVGSSDRRFISEEFWHILRNFYKLSFEANSQEPRKMLLVYLKDKPELFNDDTYGLGLLSTADKQFLENLNQNSYPDYVEAEMPQWLFEKIKDIDFCKAMNTKAPADFRINVKSRDSVLEKLNDEGFEFVPTSISPIGVRSNSRVVLGNCVAYQDGLIDVQDQSSQIACVLVNPKSHEKIMDYCCGAGGKALSLSYLLGGKGEVWVHDVNKERLENIKPRMERLKAKNIWLIPQVNDADFDTFIIDAPCSGSGTLRRSPDIKLRLTPQRLQSLNEVQKEILETAKDKVKIGGKIVYMTCSILKDENEAIVEDFLQNNPNFSTINLKSLWESKFEASYPIANEQMLIMSPIATDSDGFFICILKRNS